MDTGGSGPTTSSVPYDFTDSTQNPFVLAVTFQSGGGVQQIYHQGANVTASTSGSGGHTSNGLNLSVGSYSNGNSPFNGLISEVIVYTNTFADTERQMIECYLSNTYSITLTHGCN
jgi:hypothetical protein